MAGSNKHHLAIGVRQARLSTSVELFKALGGGWKADAAS